MPDEIWQKHDKKMMLLTDRLSEWGFTQGKGDVRLSNFISLRERIENRNTDKGDPRSGIQKWRSGQSRGSDELLERILLAFDVCEDETWFFSDDTDVFAENLSNLPCPNVIDQPDEFSNDIQLRLKAGEMHHFFGEGGEDFATLDIRPNSQADGMQPLLQLYIRSRIQTHDGHSYQLSFHAVNIKIEQVDCPNFALSDRPDSLELKKSPKVQLEKDGTDGRPQFTISIGGKKSLLNGSYSSDEQLGTVSGMNDGNKIIAHLRGEIDQCKLQTTDHSDLPEDTLQLMQVLMESVLLPRPEQDRQDASQGVFFTLASQELIARKEES